MIRAKVDTLRFYRNCVNLIHRGQVPNPVDIIQAIPLPFDDDLNGGPDENIFDEYNKLVAAGALN